MRKQQANEFYIRRRNIIYCSKSCKWDLIKIINASSCRSPDNAGTVKFRHKTLLMASILVGLEGKLISARKSPSNTSSSGTLVVKVITLLPFP